MDYIRNNIDWMIIFIIILFLILFLIFVKVNKASKQYVSIINLVLYSNDPEYDEMYRLTKNYYKSFNNVKTIYYKFNENITNNYELIDDILNIKGVETYVPGILDKTIKALEYVYDYYDFDHVVRSNISTIIDFNLFTNYLKNNNFEYGGGYRLVLQVIDQPCGIIDNTYFGTEYAAGTSIIFSKKTLKYIIDNKGKLRYNLIDDVAFAVLIDEHLNYIEKSFFPIENYIFFPNENGDPGKIKDLIKDKNYIFYRNKQNDRKIDNIQMKLIIDFIK